MIIGPPCSEAKNDLASSNVTARSNPGITGTSAARAASRARSLSPNASRCTISGPTTVSPASAQARAKIRALGKKTVPRVDGVTARRVRRRDDRFRVQIGGGTPTRQRLHFVGEADVQALRVVHRVDGDGRQTHVGSRPGDADRDLAAIGDQQFSNGHDWIVLRLEMVRRAPAAYTLRL